jgi:hypothetical protein
VSISLCLYSTWLGFLNKTKWQIKNMDALQWVIFRIFQLLTPSYIQMFYLALLLNTLKHNDYGFVTSPISLRILWSQVGFDTNWGNRYDTTQCSTPDTNILFRLYSWKWYTNRVTCFNITSIECHSYSQKNIYTVHHDKILEVGSNLIPQCQLIQRTLASPWSYPAVTCLRLTAE